MRSDITSPSRSGSIGGFVTCAKRRRRKAYTLWGRGGSGGIGGSSPLLQTASSPAFPPGSSTQRRSSQPKPHTSRRRASSPPPRERRSREHAIRERQRGGPVPGLHQALVELVESTQRCRQLHGALVRLWQEHHERVHRIATGPHQQLERVVETRRVASLGPDHGFQAVG